MVNKKKKAKVILASNIKGGVGKTSSILNIAYWISRLHKNSRVLVIDADAQANASSVVLGDEAVSNSKFNLSTVWKKMIDDKFYRPSKEELLSLIKTPSSVIIQKNGEEMIDETYEYGFHIIPTSITMNIIEMQQELEDKKANDTRKNARKQKDSQYVLYDLISCIQNYFNFDYILIDCPPNIGMFVINSILVADYMYIPMSTGILPVNGVKYTLMLQRVIQKTRGKTVEILGLVNSIYKKGKTSDFVDDTITFSFPHVEEFLTKIKSTIQAENSLIDGNLISMASKQHGECYKEITKELLWKIYKPEFMKVERAKRVEIAKKVGTVREELETLDKRKDKERYEQLEEIEKSLLQEIQTLKDLRKEQIDKLWQER